MTKILNHINTYADLTAYDNDMEKDYPNISYIQGTDEVKWVKDGPVHIVCKYNVTSTSKATKLLGSNTGISYQIIDGVQQQSVQSKYTFDTLGEHIVEYKLDGTSIGNNAFSSCTKLTSITIPDSVTSIGSSAFYYCTGLTSITIPDGVTSIGVSVFDNCSDLTSIVVDSANTVFDSRDNCNAIIKTSTNELVAGCKSTVIPNTVTSIGEEAFDGCTSLTSITIPNSVTSIGDSAFYYCTGITSITIPNSVTSIGDSAFYNCTKLTSITIPDSVTSIGSSAFYYCTGLTSITIPNSVTSIGEYVFSGCEGLTSVTVEATTPPSLGSNAFSSTSTNLIIYVPSESVSAYKAAINWRSLASRIKPISE